MDHQSHVDNLLSAFMDGELSATEAQTVSQHLAHCNACRQQLAALTAADDIVQKMDTIEPSADFERTFWKKVADVDAQQTARWWTRFGRPSWRPALAAGLAAALVVGIFVMRMPGQGVSLEDRFMAENVELLNEYDLIHNLEILENWEALEAMKELT